MISHDFLHMTQHVLLGMGSLLCFISLAFKGYSVARHRGDHFTGLRIVVAGSLLWTGVLWAAEAVGVLKSDPLTICLIIPPLLVIVFSEFENTVRDNT